MPITSGINASQRVGAVGRVQQAGYSAPPGIHFDKITFTFKDHRNGYVDLVLRGEKGAVADKAAKLVCFSGLTVDLSTSAPAQVRKDGSFTLTVKNYWSRYKNINDIQVLFYNKTLADVFRCDFAFRQPGYIQGRTLEDMILRPHRGMDGNWQ